MAQTHRLTALKVTRIGKPGRYGDGGGLYLQVAAGTTGVTKNWVFRYQNGKRERWMGLGALGAISLAEARALAADARALHQRGIDPIVQRDAAKAAAAAAAAKRITFDQCAAAYIAAHEASWRNPRHGGYWRATLADYASPLLGKLAVADIDRSLVLRALEPIWHTRPETAGRVRGRIERILDFAEARGYRPEGSNPARLLPVKTALGRRPKKVEHFAALPYGEIPAFMAQLRKREGVPFRALEFLILCAARTGEVLGATWPEINLTERTWVVPGARMKGGKEHRVPLADVAVDLLRALPRETANDFLFVGARGKGMGPGAMLLALRSMRTDGTAHGMRSSFKDWATEQTNFPTEAVEIALAHSVGSKVEQAYRRGDLFEGRRVLMEAWASYCTKAAATSEVVPLRGKAARGAARR